MTTNSRHERSGQPVISTAIELDQPKIVQSLLDAGANRECRCGTDGETPLLWAARLGSLSCVEILALVADVSAVDNAGRNALSISIIHGHTMVAKTLLRVRNLSIDGVDHEGLTPLHHAAREGNREVHEAILARNGAGVVKLVNRGRKAVGV